MEELQQRIDQYGEKLDTELDRMDQLAIFFSEAEARMNKLDSEAQAANATLENGEQAFESIVAMLKIEQLALPKEDKQRVMTAGNAADREMQFTQYLEGLPNDSEYKRAKKELARYKVAQQTARATLETERRHRDALKATVDISTARLTVLGRLTASLIEAQTASLIAQTVREQRAVVEATAAAAQKGEG